MKILNTIKAKILTFLMVVATGFGLQAQDTFEAPTTNTRAAIQQRVAATDIEVTYNRAAELMNLALESNPKHVGMLYRQALILEKKGDKKGAIEAAKKSYKEAQSLSPELKSEYSKLNTALLTQLKK